MGLDLHENFYFILTLKVFGKKYNPVTLERCVGVAGWKSPWLMSFMKGVLGGVIYEYILVYSFQKHLIAQSLHKRLSYIIT